jgi:hypothetical protein
MAAVKLRTIQRSSDSVTCRGDEQARVIVEVLQFSASCYELQFELLPPRYSFARHEQDGRFLWNLSRCSASLLHRACWRTAAHSFRNGDTERVKQIIAW